MYIYIYIYICTYTCMCVCMYVYIYIYNAGIHVYSCMYINSLAPPREDLLQLLMPFQRHDQTHCILQFMQWLWSCKFCKPFREAVSLQLIIKHSSKHAVLLSEEVQFSLRKIIQPVFNHTAFLSTHQVPTQYAVCD